MARQKLTVREYFAHHPMLMLLVIVVVLLLLAATAALGFQQLTKGYSDGATPSSSTTPAPTKFSAPSLPPPDAEGGDDDNEDAITASSDACSVLLTAEEQSAFATRVLDYEAIYQSPPSASRTASLAAFTTAQYQADYASDDAEAVTDTVVTLLRDKTTFSCAVNEDGSRLAAVHVVIETSFINDSGKKEVIYPELTLPLIHYSTWVMDSGTWKASSQE